MAKGKSGFRRSPKKKVDSPEAEAFIRGAEQRVAEDRSSEEEPSPSLSSPGEKSVREALGSAASQASEAPANHRLQAIEMLGEEARRLIELQNRSAEITLRICREAGKLLAELPHPSHATEDEAPAADQSHVLDRLDLTKAEASLWQAISGIPDDVFETFLSEVRTYSAELSRAAITRSLEDLTAEREDQALRDAPQTIDDHPGDEQMDEDFEAALDVMVNAIKNLDEDGWKKTSKKTVLQYLDMLRHMIIIDGVE